MHLEQGSPSEDFHVLGINSRNLCGQKQFQRWDAEIIIQMHYMNTPAHEIIFINAFRLLFQIHQDRLCSQTQLHGDAKMFKVKGQQNSSLIYS